MSNFAAEPVPATVDPVLSEFLARQLNAIQTAFMGNFIAPQVATLPLPVVGAVVSLNNQTNPSDNGFYGCIANSQGDGEWKRLQTA
jgi:hypothetical protein